MVPSLCRVVCCKAGKLCRVYYTHCVMFGVHWRACSATKGSFRCQMFFPEGRSKTYSLITGRSEALLCCFSWQLHKILSLHIYTAILHFVTSKVFTQQILQNGAHHQASSVSNAQEYFTEIERPGDNHDRRSLVFSTSESISILNHWHQCTSIFYIYFWIDILQAWNVVLMSYDRIVGPNILIIPDELSG